MVGLVLAGVVIGIGMSCIYSGIRNLARHLWIIGRLQ